jgi:glutamyl/glutaminyl-tRNA synthetase
VLLYKAFGWDLPIYVHMPVLRNPDKSKLSKRKNAVWSSSYLEEGFLPEAVLNYLALMGWSHPDQKEIFSKEEFIEKLDLKNISPAGPAFDRVKLEWMNGEYIRRMSDEELFQKIATFIGEGYDKDTVKKSIPIIKERIKILSDYEPLTEFLFKDPDKYEIDLSDKKNVLEKTASALSSVSSWEADKIGEVMVNTAKELEVKNSEYFMTLRVAITGKKISPPLNESMEILGKEKVIERINGI